MRFQRLRLSNFKCFADADLELGRGVTVIHGLNGSGKSSLLEACFFALYGARALDRTLDEILTIGAEEARVELWFNHDGDDYRIERGVKLRGGSAVTTTCVLEGPEETIEGANDVEAAVASRLRMDATAFVNCAYVRQGEVNKLINASPDERQDVIDDLLQLGKLEEYRERAKLSRRGVGRVRDNKQGALDDIESQIAEKETRNLHDRLAGLRSELSDVEDDIERFEQNRKKAETQREEAAATLSEYEERRAELEEIEADIEQLTDEITEAERERSTLADRASDLRTKREEHRAEIAERLAKTDIVADSVDELDGDTVDDRLAELRERKETVADKIREQSVEVQKRADEAETARERAAELDDAAERKREEADEREAAIAEKRTTVAERREQIAELDAEIDQLEARFEDAPVEPDAAAEHRESVESTLSEARSRVDTLDAKLKQAKAAVEEAEQLIEAGKCPECGQEIQGPEHVGGIEADRERAQELESELADAREQHSELESKLERARTLESLAEQLKETRSRKSNMETLVEEQADSVETDAERVDALREEAEELTADAATKRDEAEVAAAAAETARERLGELNAESSSLKTAIERVEALSDLLETLTDCTEELESLSDRRATIAETNELRRDQLTEKREQRDELAAAVDESAVEQAREQQQEAEKYLEQVEPKLASLREQRDELQGSIGAVENELDQLEELRDRRAALAQTVDRLDSLYTEVQQLEAMYGDLRAELRGRNVRKLERMLNETFDLVYGNDAYSHIELDDGYELTVYQKDGEPLDPDQLSGGERAIFNLSLRCAIYRLLAEGIDGSAPMPPLILDEPTVFLDSGHVSKLVDLVESMTDLGVSQILVVSHDDELVGAADELIGVRKDPTTNRSSVERMDAADAAALSAFS